jgi:hypothetical protein
VITLITPHAESMYDPAGLDKTFEKVRTKVGQLARRIVSYSGRPSYPKVDPPSEPGADPTFESESDLACGPASPYRVLVISSSGDETPPGEFVDHNENPLIVRIRRRPLNSAPDSLLKAVIATANVVKLIESFCTRAGWRSRLVLIDNADFYFYPTSELGAFTRRLDKDTELVKQIGAIGECLAGYDGHLILAAALSQHSDRLRDILDDYGWSWVRCHRRGFERMCGNLPDILRDWSGSKPEPVPVIQWSSDMTIQQLANRFHCGRAKMSRQLNEWLEKGTKPVQKFGAKWRIRLDELPPKKPQ